MNYWLIKSEGSCYSIDDLKKDKRTAWTGIRNFQARNFMKNDMSKGDLLLFYHSNSKPSGVYGIAQVVSTPHIDETSLDSHDEHYDAKALKYIQEGKEPLWSCVDIKFVTKLKRPISLEELKEDTDLREMLVCRTGQRLSIMPVLEKHFKKISNL